MSPVQGSHGLRPPACGDGACSIICSSMWCAMGGSLPLYSFFFFRQSPGTCVPPKAVSVCLFRWHCLCGPPLAPMGTWVRWHRALKVRSLPPGRAAFSQDTALVAFCVRIHYMRTPHARLCFGCMYGRQGGPSQAPRHMGPSHTRPRMPLHYGTGTTGGCVLLPPGQCMPFGRGRSAAHSS